MVLVSGMDTLKQLLKLRWNSNVVHCYRKFWWMILHLQGKVAFVSAYGIHQLHIFIFVLAIFHILQCIVTLTLGRTKVLLTQSSPWFWLQRCSKQRLYIVSELVCGIFLCCSLCELIHCLVQWMQMRKWRAWENETKTIEYQFYNGKTS